MDKELKKKISEFVVATQTDDIAKADELATEIRDMKIQTRYEEARKELESVNESAEEGQFISKSDMEDFLEENDVEYTTSSGVGYFDTTYKNHNNNKVSYNGLKYFVLVGGGYRGFTNRFSAQNYYKSN